MAGPVPRVVLLIIGLLLGACRDSAYRAATKVDSIDGWRRFVAANPEDQNVDAAKARWAELEFDEAKKAHTVIGYKRFLEAWPDAAQSRAARALLETLRFNAAREKGSAQALRQFVREHPEGVHREEADTLLKRLELEEVARLEEPATLARIAAENPDDPRAAEVSTRLDEVAWGKASGPAGWLDYLAAFPAGAHRDEARVKVLSAQLEGLVVSGLLEEAKALLTKSPLRAALVGWPQRLESARALEAVERSAEERVRRVLPAWSRRAFEDVVRSLQAPDPMDRWQAAEELGHFVTIRAIDPLLEQVRLARNPLIRQAAFDSLQRVLRALPRVVAEYEVATRLAALSSTASDAQLYLTRAALLDLSGQLEKAVLEYQRAWDPQQPDPLILRRWVTIRQERRQFFAGAVTARQLAMWAKDAASQAAPPTGATAVLTARELCAAAVNGELALQAITAARGAQVEFPDDLEGFEVRAKDAVKLVRAKLRDAELVMLEVDGRARACGNQDARERLAEGEKARLEALEALLAKPPRNVADVLQVVRLRDPSEPMRAAAAPR